MAYRYTNRNRGYSQRRSTRTRSGYTRARRRTGKSVSRRSSSRPQTVRIELVGVPANPISRSVPPSLVAKPPRDAKF